MTHAHETPGAAQLAAETRLALKDLSVVREHDELVVGDPIAGVFFTVPEVGAVALQALREGKTVAEAATVASAYAGEEVNVLEFAEVLLGAGFVEAIDGRPVAGAVAQPRSRLERIPPAAARRLFGRPAWAVYGCLTAFWIAVFAARPDFRPSFEDWFFYPNPAVCLIVVTATAIVAAAVHELWHWLAARAQGVSARFSVSRRMFFPVFETDVSQLWSVERSRRYGPFLAGMALDSSVLALALGLRVAWAEGVALPPLVVRCLGALVLLTTLGLAFQFLVFLRTDLYAVLTTVLGCRNLYRVNWLTLKRLVIGLPLAEAAELEQAHPRDRRVARWFGAVYVAGALWAAWVFVTFFVPGTLILGGWMFLSVTGAPIGSAMFWQALAIGSVLTLQALLPLAVFIRERGQARRPEPA